MSHIVKGLLIVLVAAAAAGCSRKEREWTEDVRLEDGSVVRVERFVVFDETNAIGGGAYNAVEAQATLKFTGELASLPVWDFPRIALVLYRNKAGNWVVVSGSSSCEVWRKAGRPLPPYWEHELTGSQWSLRPEVSEESIGRKPNLFYRYTGSSEPPQHITPEVTRASQSDIRIADKYRSIAAQPSGFGC